QLVDHRSASVPAGPVVVGEGEPGGVEVPGGGVHPGGLPRAARIRVGALPVHQERVVLPVGQHPAQVPPLPVPDEILPAPGQLHLHPLGSWCPDPQRAAGHGEVTRSSTATGPLRRSSANGTSPAWCSAVETTSRHRPSGSTRLCSAQPPTLRSCCSRRVTTVTTSGASATVRANATACPVEVRSTR